ncbi:MAG: hypothetical protein ABIP79_14255 [Chitinophagaceae bacterium]
MENTALSFNRENAHEDPQTLHSFLSVQSSNAQQFFKDGTSFVKEELTSLYLIAEIHLQKMMLPVNNFLKDMRQVDCELEYECKKQSGLICEGNIVPLEQALLSPMEEN